VDNCRRRIHLFACEANNLLIYLLKISDQL
jgi:hypothetical protein